MLHYSTINRNLNKLLRLFWSLWFPWTGGGAHFDFSPRAPGNLATPLLAYIAYSQTRPAHHMVRCRRGTEMQAGFQLENMKGRGGPAGGW